MKVCFLGQVQISSFFRIHESGCLSENIGFLYTPTQLKNVHLKARIV